MGQLKEYDAKIDTKHRLTLRGARFAHYHVREFDDGRIELEPRELVAPFEVSVRTLAGMDSSVQSLKANRVSEPVDLSAFAD